jgi:catechol 2,3-dioxygenase-like lactoylglutathione lyase family enzyme
MPALSLSKLVSFNDAHWRRSSDLGQCLMAAHLDTILFPNFLGKQMQIGYVVKDIDAALRFWTEQMKVGPFVIVKESLGDRRFVHRGKVSDVKMSVALSYIGETQIEVIAQSNSAPSPYTEFFASGREGLQHVAFTTDDYAQACRQLEACGFEEVCSVQLSDGTKNVSYYSGPPHLGAMVELIPMTPARQRYYAAIKKLAQEWDGSQPVRRFKTRAEFLASDVCNPEEMPQGNPR